MTYMSYMHGPHMDSTQDIYFGGDGFVVRQKMTESKDAPSPPAWLIADWILAKKKGEILSNRLQVFYAPRRIILESIGY